MRQPYLSKTGDCMLRVQVATDGPNKLLGLNLLAVEQHDDQDDAGQDRLGRDRGQIPDQCLGEDPERRRTDGETAIAAMMPTPAAAAGTPVRRQCAATMRASPP